MAPEAGVRITTSEVYGLVNQGGYYLLETKYSRYICVGDPNYDHMTPTKKETT